MSFSADDQKTLLELANTVISYGIEFGVSMHINPNEYPLNLQANCATFVTIKIDGDIRGCIGTLKPYQSLVEDVAEHAYKAAFEDPRFPPISRREAEKCNVSISVLSEPEEIEFDTQDDLVSKLQPGVDGLILEAGEHTSTFLPQVWDDIEDPSDFLRGLKMKLGMRQDYWSHAVKAKRYTTQSISID